MLFSDEVGLALAFSELLHGRLDDVVVVDFTMSTHLLGESRLDRFLKPD